jgi:hypothetical protein
MISLSIPRDVTAFRVSCLGELICVLMVDLLVRVNAANAPQSRRSPHTPESLRL